MAKVEYRSERVERADPGAAVAHLNRWGEEGWQVFQLDRTDDGYQVWLSRELPIMAGGLPR